MARKRKPPNIQGESLSSPRPHPSLGPQDRSWAQPSGRRQRARVCLLRGWEGEGRLCTTLFFFRLRDARGGVCRWLGIWRHLETLVATLLPYTLVRELGICCFSLAPQGSAWRGEATSLGCWSQSVHLQSPASVTPFVCLFSQSLAPLLFFIPRVTSSAFIFSTFLSLGDGGLAICDYWPGSLGAAIQAGGRGFQLGLAPCCSFGDRLPKTWKVEGWKGWQEVMERACC